MKFDFTKIQLADINGVPYPKQAFYKTIADTVWRNAISLDLVEIAMAINRGEEVELNEVKVAELKRIVVNPKNGIFAYARKAAIEYIESVQKEIDNKEEKESEAKKDIEDKEAN